MTYRMEAVEDADLVYIVPRMFETIGNDFEFINALYPGHQTQEGQRKITSRFISIKNSPSNTKWMKAVSSTSGEIVGFALWTIIDEEKPPETEVDGPVGTWPSDEEKEYCKAMYRAFLIDRRKMIRENDLPIMIMNMMAVFKDYQRQGIGQQLMADGLHLADQLSALCTVEATPTGMKLYQKGGFVVEKEYHLSAGEGYADRRKDHIFFMIRPRGGQGSRKPL